MFNASSFNIQDDFNQYLTGDNEFNVDVDINMSGANQGMVNMGSVSSPVIEPMQQRVVNRTIMHEVPHICPINTKIINNHVYRHTYSPRYTCCEENVCTNIQCGSCCCFNNR